MSAPETDEEHEQANRTRALAGPADRPVCTACRNCRTRFALLANYSRERWHLLCTVCGWHGRGELT